MLGRLVNRALERVTPDYPWGDTAALFRGASWRACNLECALSDRGSPWTITEKAFHFRSDARNIAVLKAAGIDAVSLANNHILDFEYEAMADTMALLDGAKIDRAGAGANIFEASRAAIRSVGEIKVGFVACTDNEPDWQAGPSQPGTFYVPIDAGDERAQRLFETVRETRRRADIVVVSLHWGPNWGYQAPIAHVRFAHSLVEAGADIVFGHSGHVFRGVELYRGRPIMYCTGNFVDDYAVDEVERNDQSFVFIVEVIAGRLRSVQLHPTVIRDCQALLAEGAEANEIALKMRQLCSELDTEAQWRAKDPRLDIPIPGGS